MTDLGHPGAPLRAFRGRARRTVEREHRAGGPWDAVVRLCAVEESGGTYRLEVEAEWTGFLPGAPAPSPGVSPGRCTDVVVVPRLDVGQAVMRAASEALRKPEAPNLRLYVDRAE